MRKIIISLGGSLICPDRLDADFIKKFKDLIEDYSKKDFMFVIVCGGGKVAREYQQVASSIKQIDNMTKDWLGIYATKINALLLKSVFDKTLVYENIIDDPNLIFDTSKKIFISSGYRPGCSTDYDATLLAETMSSHLIINMSNVDHIFDSDPRTNPNAKKYEKITWKEYRTLICCDWNPGLNTPFDPIASKKAQELDMKVIIIGKDLENLKNVLDEKDFSGTLIFNL